MQAVQVNNSKTVKILYGKEEIELKVPASTEVLEGQNIPAVSNYDKAITDALANPISAPSLKELLDAKNPSTVAITISDITRPVPNKLFMPHLLKVLNDSGIKDSQIVIVIGTGMHRPSTPEERDILLGSEIISRVEVIDHIADDPEALLKISENPPISVCTRFVKADFRIVTGYIEAHFMAGFSGGRKGVCPALVDLKTIERFHGYKTLAAPKADNGILKGNPCHEIALEVAKRVGVDFLFNVSITKDRKIAGIYCGDLEEAHRIGCEEVSKNITVYIDEPYDFVITNGGGYPLDQNFYQTVKGMCTALPALGENSTLLVISECREKLGSKAYTDLLLQYNNDWEKFLKDIEEDSDITKLDQWELQMQTRVLKRIGLDKLWFVSDGIPYDIQKCISVTPILGPGNFQKRAQQAIDKYIEKNPNAKIAVIPEGPYVMIRKKP